jgi:hypothetical protein
MVNESLWGAKNWSIGRIKPRPQRRTPPRRLLPRGKNFRKSAFRGQNDCPLFRPFGNEQ